MVHLYNYLLAGANAAPRTKPADPQLVTRHAVAEGGLVGPFYVRIPLALNVTDGQALVDADGVAIDGHGPAGTRLLHSTGAGHVDDNLDHDNTAGVGGRVLTGVAAEDSPQRFHPGRAGGSR